MILPQTRMRLGAQAIAFSDDTRVVVTPVPVAAPLDPYASPLTADDARHLLRRTGFGAAPARVSAFTGMTASAAARLLLDDATNASTLATPAWYGTAVTNQNTVFTAERQNILARMTQAPLREKMALFWHNHFPVEAGIINAQANVVVNGVTTTVYYTPAIIWSYYRLLRDNALGNLRTLVAGIGQEPAMLRYLNGNTSTVGAPNQNYGRELLELFTMGIYNSTGQRNYTDTDTGGTSSDVYMAARALTGWRDRVRTVNGANTYTYESYFTQSRFDTGSNKTFLGQTGAWGYDDVVRLIFEQRGAQTAWYLARKLLAFFVNAVPDAAATQALAALIVASNFEMRPVLEALFASTHFFAPGYRGALVKSPTDLYLGAAAGLNTNFAATAFNWATLLGYTRGNATVEERSHLYFEPPNVAGWPGHNPPSAAGRENFRVWYSADDFSGVWTNLRALASTPTRFPYEPLGLVTLASDPNDPFSVALALGEHLLAVPLAYASIPDKSALKFGGNQDIAPPTWVASAPRYVSDLAKTLLAGAPHYEWATMTTANKTTLVRNYLLFLLTEVPEAMLM